MTPRTALITGVTGQDGSYLAELLLGKGYRVVGLRRRSATENLWRIQHFVESIELVDGDLLDQGSLDRVVQRVRPDEIYNLAAQSFVGASWDQPDLTTQVTGLGALRMLEAMRKHAPHARFYQASSSEMFGKVAETPQDEDTPFHPRSPYGVAKVFAHHMTVNYRESYDLFCCSGILFNHESPRRGLEFVTRKITDGVAQILAGKARCLFLGNLDAKRDWGHAMDYVAAMHAMLQADEPQDYVVATGETHSVREFVKVAFELAGLDWRKHVRSSDDCYRPAEVDLLLGDASRIRADLGWTPRVGFHDLVRTMLAADLDRHGVYGSERPRVWPPSGIAV